MSEDIRISFQTTKGVIEALVFASQVPVTAASFLNLMTRGFYDRMSFHRVVPDFMIQAGDPTGTGAGGPGYQFEDEILPHLLHDRPGMLSMANTGPKTNGSQFFITHCATPELDRKHTVFGEVTHGQKVVAVIVAGDFIRTAAVLDSTDDLFAEQADRIAKWNRAMG